MKEFKYNKRVGHMTRVVRQVTSWKGQTFYLKMKNGKVWVKCPSSFLETYYIRISTISYSPLRDWLESKAK